VSQPHPVPPELLLKSAILDALIKGVLMVDHESRVAWINRPLERLLGVDHWLTGDEVAVVKGVVWCRGRCPGDPAQECCEISSRVRM